MNDVARTAAHGAGAPTAAPAQLRTTRAPEVHTSFHGPDEATI